MLSAGAAALVGPAASGMQPRALENGKGINTSNSAELTQIKRELRGSATCARAYVARASLCPRTGSMGSYSGAVRCRGGTCFRPGPGCPQTCSSASPPTWRGRLQTGTGVDWPHPSEYRREGLRRTKPVLTAHLQPEARAARGETRTACEIHRPDFRTATLRSQLRRRPPAQRQRGRSVGRRRSPQASTGARPGTVGPPLSRTAFQVALLPSPRSVCCFNDITLVRQ